MREKREGQLGILAECWERLRPIRVRNVGGSGTKGVGEGMGGLLVVCACRQRLHMVMLRRTPLEVGREWMMGFRTIIAVVGVVVCEFEELGEWGYCFLDGFCSPMVSAESDIVRVMKD